MERFVGKLAVVTGASSGIGSEIAKELVKHGVIVVGLARRLQKLQELADLISSENSTYKAKGKFHFHECDVTDSFQIKKAFEWIDSKLGGISILVNNAGTFTMVSLIDLSETNYDNIFDTNVKGAFMCAKEAMNSMTKHKLPGHIININSIFGLTVFNVLENTHILYTATKHALRAFSEGLKLEMSKKNLPIKVSNISPGPTISEMLNNSLAPVFTNKPKFDDDEILQGSDVAKACIAVLDTSPYCVDVRFSSNRVKHSRTRYCSCITNKEIGRLIKYSPSNSGCRGTWCFDMEELMKIGYSIKTMLHEIMNYPANI